MNISTHLLFIHLETLSAFVVVIVVIYPPLSHSLYIPWPSLSLPLSPLLLLLSVSLSEPKQGGNLVGRTQSHLPPRKCHEAGIG